MINTIIFPVYLLFCFFSIFGYGKLITSILSLEKIDLNLGELIFFGFAFIFCLSIFFHLIIPLNFLFNSFFLFFGFINFLFNFDYFKKKISFKTKKNYLIFFLLIPTVIVIRTHADYEWYHLPYINYVNNFKIIFGLANFSNNLAFGHGWQDILSLFSLYYIETRGLTSISIIFYFSYLFCLLKYIEREKDQNIRVLIQIILFFSLAIFNKLIDFGAEAQPLMMMILFGLNVIYFVKNNEEKFLILLIFCFIFSIILRFGSIVFIPSLILIFIFKFKEFYNYLLINKKFVIFILITGFLLLTRNYIHSGCLVFPLYFTCLFNDFISWSVPIELVIERFSVLSSISKGWAFYLKDIDQIEHINLYYKLLENNKIIHPREYANNLLFWPKYWFRDHDTSRIANVILLISISCFIFMFTKDKKIKEKRKFIETTLLVSFLISVVFWFISSPQTRYGGYAIIGITITYFYYYFFLKYEYNFKKNNLAFVFLIILALIYVSQKNFSRLKNLNLNDFQKFPFPNYSENLLNIDYYQFEVNDFKINLKKHEKNKVYGDPIMCGNIQMICIPESLKVCIKNIKKTNGYLFIINNENECYQQYVRNYWQH